MNKETFETKEPQVRAPGLDSAPTPRRDRRPRRSGAGACHRLSWQWGLFSSAAGDRSRRALIRTCLVPNARWEATHRVSLRKVANPKPYIVVSRGWPVLVAAGGADVFGIIEPRAAALHTGALG